MKCSLLFVSFVVCSLTLFGQGSKPFWITSIDREISYPASSFFTGFSSGKVSTPDDVSKVTDLVIKDAQKTLLESIRVTIKSEMSVVERSVRANGKEQLHADYSQHVQSSASAELIGVKTESYYDKSAKVVYAFAYVNKHELTGYYKSNLSVNIGQIESYVKTAQDLVAHSEKAQARRQLETVVPLFAKVRYAQDLLTAVDVTVAADELQQARTENLYSRFIQMQAQLAQGIYVYVESREDLFGKKIDIVANKVKAELAKNGCSFTEQVEQADFTLKINVSARGSSNTGGIVFCYADVVVELYDSHKQKVVYGDEMTQKGGSNTQDKAARKAMNDVVPKITEKLKTWIQ